jgi:hypothetical protein
MPYTARIVEKENEESREPQREQREEVVRLLQLLDEAMVKSKRSRRAIERDLDMGQGYLGSLLRGRIMLKVGLVWTLGEALDVEPLLLLYKSASREHKERFLRELGVRLAVPGQETITELPLTRPEIVELVHKILAEEVELVQKTRALIQNIPRREE